MQIIFESRDVDGARIRDLSMERVGGARRQIIHLAHLSESTQ